MSLSAFCSSTISPSRCRTSHCSLCWEDIQERADQSEQANILYCYGASHTKQQHMTPPSCVSPGPLWCLYTCPASAAAPHVLRQTGRSSVCRTPVAPWRDAGLPAARGWGEVESPVLYPGCECWLFRGGKKIMKKYTKAYSINLYTFHLWIMNPKCSSGHLQ